jgi:taurine dioxygenase
LHGSKEAVAAIRAALIQHQAIFFHGQQGFSPEEHRRFAGAFGSLEDQAGKLTILEEGADRAALISNDMSYERCPPMGSIMQSLVGPSGISEFVSLTAAFDALPLNLQQEVAGLYAEHSFAHGLEDGQEAAAKEHPPVGQPVVRTHPESREQALFVNSLFTTRILGMDDDESDQMLGQLFSHIEQPEFKFRFEWQSGSVAFWDSRVTQHRPITSSGKMQKITIAGDKPFYFPFYASV